ncbi:MAG: TlpA family protein disulfide reductase, partial [Sphingobacteriaceae bacterium]
KVTPKLSLDSSGKGEIILPIKSRTFISMQIGDSVLFNFLVEPGFDLKYIINEKSTMIKGNGSNENIYFQLIQPLISALNKRSDSLIEVKASVDKLLQTFNETEIKLTKLFNNYTDSFNINEINKYILKNGTLSTILLQKQKCLLSIENALIDSLSLYNKFGLIYNPIFKDTILIKTKYINFLNFLIYNFEQTIGNKIFKRNPKNNIYPILLFGSINNDQKYSERIKEFLLYAELTTELVENGINNTLENTCEVFFDVFKNSEYSKLLKKRISNYKPLSKDSPAPGFWGRSLSGKQISISDYKGKVLLIDIWATWCKPCISEFSYTDQILMPLTKNNDFVIIYASIDRDKNKWKTFVTKSNLARGINIVIEDKIVLDKYKISGVPRYILINKDGLIVNAFCEKPSLGTLKNRIKEIL